MIQHIIFICVTVSTITILTYLRSSLTIISIAKLRRPKWDGNFERCKKIKYNGSGSKAKPPVGWAWSDTFENRNKPNAFLRFMLKENGSKTKKGEKNTEKKAFFVKR